MSPCFRCRLPSAVLSALMVLIALAGHAAPPPSALLAAPVAPLLAGDETKIGSGGG